MTKTALYVRVSSQQQVHEGDSIAAQLDALRKYAKANKMKIVGEYVDDGISGTKYSKRDELQRLLAEVEADRVDLICFTKLDRWFRSIKHYVNTQAILDAHNVDWLAIWEPVYDTTTPAGRLIVNQMMSIAQFEAENTSARIKHVQAYKVSQREVISGNVTPGYKIENKHLVVDPEKADAVRLCFDTFLRTESLTAASKAVQDFGFPHSVGGIKQLLRREVYIGRAYGLDDYCEPIIDRATFDAVQRLLPLNVKSNAKHVYLFSGLLRCSDCGCVMAAYTRKQAKRKPTSLYRCACHYQRAGKDCHNAKLVTENVLERQLLAMLPDLVIQQVQIEEDRKRVVVDVEKQRKALERKIDRLKELYINELIDMEEYKTDKSRLLDELGALEDVQTPSETSANALLELVGMNIEEIYQTLSKAEKRTFWRSLIKTIWFDHERVFSFEFMPDAK